MFVSKEENKHILLGWVPKEDPKSNGQKYKLNFKKNWLETNEQELRLIYHVKNTTEGFILEI